MLNTPRVLVAIVAATLIAGCGIKKATHQKALDSLAAWRSSALLRAVISTKTWTAPRGRPCSSSKGVP